MFTGDVTIVEEELVRISEQIVKENCPDLMDELLHVGWVTSRNLLGAKEWRYQFTYNKSL